MALVLERIIAPVTGVPARRFTEETESALEISVVFTSVDATKLALKKAAELALGLGGRVTLIVPQIVPYPLPLARPPASVDFNEQRMRAIANCCPLETCVLIYLCRDAFETLRSVLNPRSLVVVASRKRWWPTAEKRWPPNSDAWGTRWLSRKGSNSYARSVLRRNRLSLFVCLLGFYEGLRQVVGGIMDYIIAGFTSLGLLVYLLYALLRPEKF